ncbi:helix-turn-helix domain-containing protein [Burkholderia multivorans]|uniref:helix-turn-helix domain-containing protein n=1 Tax=Burkholderia multivorans TaxID=87883 RepID=UPI00158DA7FD|nr:AraC family transcriptional regulator [Burkholderia multivorans]
MSDPIHTAAPDDGVPVSLRSSRGRGWRGFGAALLGIRAGTYRIPAADHHRIGVHVGAPVRADCACDGQRMSRIQAHGDIDVIPAGLPGRWTDSADCRILHITLDDAFVRRTAEQLELTPSRAQIRRRMLSPQAAARVIDYVDAHLDRRLTLTELAALVSISVPHFKVLFRETIGMPVHQYVVRRRVERAKALLLEGRLTLSQIALEAGFAHQSHMANWMNRVLGATPAEIARSGVRATTLRLVGDRGGEEAAEANAPQR